ncbi:hypothetical protein RB195_026297 [Necator americanus]|uniref:Uncharacterized protein n=1 Tax=Necator americanus TaxID=51031 RepID=A0ABR1EWM4_NECAM
MGDEPSKAQFFFTESGEDSLGLVDSKTGLTRTASDPSRNGGCTGLGSSFPLEEQTELPIFSENIQTRNAVAASTSFTDTTDALGSSATYDVPVMLTEDGSNDSVNGEVPTELQGGTNFSETAACEVATPNAQGSKNVGIADSEDVAIEVVEVDTENAGDVPDAPLNDSLDGVPPLTGTSMAANNHLCEVSDDEMDQLPKGRPNKELDQLVDCDSFRSGTGRASSIPPESPPPGESFIYSGGGREWEVSRSPPAPPSTPPRDDRRTRLENLKKLNFPTKYKMKERIDDVLRTLSPPHGPSTPPYDNTSDGTQPKRNVRSFLDEPGSELLLLSRTERENSSSRNRSPEISSRRKRRHDDDGDRGDDRDRGRHAWNDSNDRRGFREDWRSDRDDQHHSDLDNGLEDLSNNPAELQRRCNAHIAMSENQAATVSDDQLFNAVSEALYLLANAQRLCKKREKLLNEMKAMRQGEVDMMKAIHADLPAHLQSVVRIEGDSVFINEAGARECHDFDCSIEHFFIVSGLASGLPSSTSVPPFQQSYNTITALSGVYVNPSQAPSVGPTPFLVHPGVPAMISAKPTVPVMQAVISSAVQPATESITTPSVTVAPPSKSESPELETQAESSMSSSFTNMPSSFSHPPPPLSSCAPPSNAPPSTVQSASSPGPGLAGLPDFSKPPPALRPVNGTSNGPLAKAGSSSALPDVGITSSRSSSSAVVTSSTVPPPSTAPPLNFNVPPPNVQPSTSATARAPYMQPSNFLCPPPGTSNTAAASDFTKTITNMITSALKAPGNAGMNAFGAGPGIRTYASPSISIMAVPSHQNMHDSNSGNGEAEWSSSRGRFQYRGKSGYGKRQGNDHRRGERQRDGTPRSFDSPKR